MLRKSVRVLAFRLSNPPKLPLVKINVEMKGKLFTFEFQENTKLGPNL